MSFLAIAALGLLASAPVRCEADRAGYCTQPVVRGDIYYDTSKNMFRLTVALGQATTVQLPEGTYLEGKPVVGNKGLASVSVFESEGAERVTINPRVARSALRNGVTEESLYGQETNIQLMFPGRLSVNLSIRFGPKKRAVQVLELSFPEREKESAYIRSQVGEYQKKLAEEYETKRAQLRTEAEALAQHTLAKNMLKGMRCHSVDDREMHEGIVLGVQDICSVGNQVFVRILLKNRKRGDFFRVQAIEVTSPGSGDLSSSTVWEREGAATLTFGQSLRGVVSFLLEEGEGTTGFVVRAVEAAGAQRTITVDEVGF